MTDRIIDLSERPAKLCVRNELLIIATDDGDTTIPLADISVVVVSHPCVTFSQAVLAGLAEAGAAFVACNAKHMPVAMLLPLETHFVQGERMALQTAASLPTCKRLWQQVVRAKVLAQAKVLAELRGRDEGLSVLARRVRSGDPENIEAQAARRYWPVLFDNPDFRRRRDGPPPNPLLNYGYTILRAMAARAVCAAGLHPSFGFHHHSRYDAFRLADDLMEPFRPWVDRAVAKYCQDHGLEVALDKNAKAAILLALTRRFNADGEARTLFDILTRVAQSLAQVYARERDNLALPSLDPL